MSVWMMTSPLRRWRHEVACMKPFLTGDVRDDDIHQERRPPRNALAASISMRWLLLSVGEGVLYDQGIPCRLVSRMKFMDMVRNEAIPLNIVEHHDHVPTWSSYWQLKCSNIRF